MVTAGEPKTRREREFDGNQRRDAVMAEDREEGIRATARGMKKGTGSYRKEASFGFGRLR
ncbi:hypothetical protein E2562_034742 [Oryza meyeriana var. granulata]|uniref:Uncharacterized protein n=1 Tax=Oryza meyeriana var. granulata TaxID=110450 RepID=A0A6G1CY67_9ORYZ|nr:hypothetical protein E2562_034742 [Oryza meyeriana var. granulata]